MRNLIPLVIVVSLLLSWARASQATDGVSTAAISLITQSISGTPLLVNANAFVGAIPIIVHRNTGERFMKPLVNREDRPLPGTSVAPCSGHTPHRSLAAGSSGRSGNDGKPMDVWLFQKPSSSSKLLDIERGHSDFGGLNAGEG
jgi:hypothetical protein